MPNGEKKLVLACCITLGAISGFHMNAQCSISIFMTCFTVIKTEFRALCLPELVTQHVCQSF